MMLQVVTKELQQNVVMQVQYTIMRMKAPISSAKSSDEDDDDNNDDNDDEQLLMERG